MRELLQVHTINLSVAVWVGFLALFGIASDDGVVIASYLDDDRDHHDAGGPGAVLQRDGMEAAARNQRRAIRRKCLISQE